MAEPTGYDLTHKKILDSAKKIFLKKGYEKTNLREICANAGVTTGAFYRHFKNKVAVFSELVKPVVQLIHQMYSKIKKESFDSLKKNHPEDLAKLNLNGAIEATVLMYKKKKLFELLTCKSYGTKYENFIDTIVKMEDINRKKSNAIIAEIKQKEVDIPDEAMHLLNHAYVSALKDIIVHGKSEEYVRENTKIVTEFFNEGWKKLRGFKKR